MKTTRVFSDTLQAYLDGIRIIANRGSSRSSKTFSELQLIYIIAKNSKKQRVISIVSHSLPHLEGGAIRDFDNILRSEGIEPENIRTKKPYLYKINKSIVEFIGFDYPGKALGAARDILFINEANKLPFEICNQLMIRTTETIFLDWNPSEDFWFDIFEYEKENDCRLIKSNFFENIENLSEGQINDFKKGKKRALAEERAGRKGYWWNWWQVYGLGKKGVLEGVIFPTWYEYDELPDCELFKIFVVDWGGNDPTTLTELNFDGKNNRLYIKEHIYQPQILNSKLIEYIQIINPNNLPVICDSARKDKIYELQMAGINALGSTKGAGSILDGLDMMHEFEIYLQINAENAIFEFRNYKRIKDERTGKFMDIPEDKNNHIIDAVRYGVRFYRRNVKPL